MLVEPIGRRLETVLEQSDRRLDQGVSLSVSALAPTRLVDQADRIIESTLPEIRKF